MGKYEEALERAKQGLPIDEVFPELKESEDEKIRKWLVDYFAIIGKSWIHREFTCEQILAYLEKQKVNTEGDFARGYDCGYECCLNSHGAEWLEKQKEQKPNVELIQKSWYLEGYHDGKYNNEPKWLIQTDKGVPMYEENPKYGTQNPAEWGEEDERNLYNTIEAIKYTFDVSEGSSGSRLITWLKYRLRYQPHWKPSKEQIEILSRFNDPVLKSLHYDLLKLF